MKGKIISIVAFSLLLFPLAGCIESGSTAPVQPIVTATDQAQNTRLDNLTNEINTAKANIASLQARPTGANQADIDSLRSKVTALEAEIATLKTQNTQMAADIAALKAGNSGTTPSETGTVIFTNNPVSIPQIFSSSAGASSSPWIMTIKNNSSTWQYVKPVVQLNVASGQPNSIVEEVTLLISGGACTMTGSLTNPGNMSFSPNNMATVATPSIVIIPVSGCNGSGEIQIGPGQSQAVNMQIQNLRTPDPILWNVTTSISSRSM